jgi:5-oxoprolinase (ATP-hydrolysing)
VNHRVASREGSSARWEVFVDIGGTFTDCLALDPDGQAHRIKVLSSGVVRAVVERGASERGLELRPVRGISAGVLVGWRARLATGGAAHVIVAVEPGTWRIELDVPIESPGAVVPGAIVDLFTGEEAPVLALRLITGTPTSQPLPMAAMRLATTRGTNALLEKRGVPAALFVTRGFGDLLRIGDQSRPDLFALHIVKPEPVCQRTVEVDERIDADGKVLRGLDLGLVAEAVDELRAAGIESAAVALMNSYVNPSHEQALAARLRELGVKHVSVSSELAPLIKIVPRAQTAAVDATLAPIVSDYVEAVQRALGSSDLRMMTSAGGMVQAQSFRAKDGLLSGPAGGVVGALAAARRSGFSRIISFDMGGTSTDVARIDAAPEYRSEHDVAGVRVFAAALAIETVAAGGGSICDFVQDVLAVGPRSAGAHPGPACYGVGGPLTLTDVNLLLGRLSPGMFEIPISIDAAEAALQRLRERIQERTGTKPEREALLEGFLSVANQRMAEGIARVSVRYGYDPADSALVAFGGAGAQHACAIADLLGMRTIIVPAEASLLSALGLAHAPVERFAQRQVLERLSTCAAKLEAMFAELEGAAAAQLANEGGARGATVRRFADLRLAGQETALTVELTAQEQWHAEDGAAAALSDAFAAAYRAMYGHLPGPAGKGIEVVALRVVVAMPGREGARLDAALQQRVEQRFVDGNALRAGDAIASGAVIAGASTCCVVTAGWSGGVDAGGAIVLRRGERETASDVGAPQQSSLAREALVSNCLTSIAETMGEQLRRTAVSTNVKERLDFSCAILDADGALVVSAAHIPVHLGALGHCVRAVIDVWQAQGKRFRAGDVVVTNHPAFGGSHLPDVTVVTPVFASDGELIGFAASRAHHAEIGGLRPGSMPPSATRLFEEGVVIEPTLLVEGGTERFEGVELLLRSGAHPSRAVGDNIADLRAAVSANHHGAVQIRNLAEEIGVSELRDHMAGALDRCERLVREALVGRPQGRRDACDQMDDGALICVRAELDGEGVTIDFTGTAPVHAGNLNATPAIVHSAVMYVMRLLVDEAVPLNDGLMRAVNVVLPTCMLNPPMDAGRSPRNAPAVVGGNTETSQRIVDVLLSALGVCACSQGTMNNVVFGTDTWAYYETICGGSGASVHGNGADAVHTHMTNTRITDPEVFEKRYPARLERFAIRRGSGGAGAFHGGAGVVREMTFLQPVQLSLLTQRRRVQPCGLNGGEPGAKGTQRLIRANGEVEHLASIDERDVDAGDRLIIETPGGGGFGEAGAS